MVIFWRDDNRKNSHNTHARRQQRPGLLPDRFFELKNSGNFSAPITVLNSWTGESDLGGLVAHNSQSSLDKCTLTQRTLSDVWLLEQTQQVHSHCGN